MNSPRILTFDLESSPHINANWGLFKQNVAINQIISPARVLCWAGKWYGDRRVEFRSEFHDDRSAMVKRSFELFDEADIVVGWNTVGFDIPKIQTEWLLAGLGQPSPWYDVDMLPPARKEFDFASNKLDYVAQLLGLGRKVRHPGMPMWLGCMNGDPRSWAQMRRYNIGDVRLEENVYTRLRPWLKNHPHMGLFEGDPLVDKCSRCASPELEKRGFHLTRVGKFQRYQCRKCGSWSTSGRAVARVNVRGIS